MEKKRLGVQYLEKNYGLLSVEESGHIPANSAEKSHSIILEPLENNQEVTIDLLQLETNNQTELGNNIMTDHGPISSAYYYNTITIINSEQENLITFPFDDIDVNKCDNLPQLDTFNNDQGSEQVLYDNFETIDAITDSMSLSGSKVRSVQSPRPITENQKDLLIGTSDDVSTGNQQTESDNEVSEKHHSWVPSDSGSSDTDSDNSSISEDLNKNGPENNPDSINQDTANIIPIQSTNNNENLTVFPNTILKQDTATITPMQSTVNENLTEAASVENKVSRKRKRQENKWKRNVAKKLKNTGQSYVSSTGKEVNGRRLREPCGSKCRLKCRDKISLDDRGRLFQQFWEMGNVNKQREYIIRHIKSVSPKYIYKRVNPTRDRSENKAYHFQVENKFIRVCRLFFLNTLNIGDTMLRNALKKTNSEGFIDEDRRGKHSNHAKLDTDTKQFIRDHIESIPKIESHYLRAQSSRDYIDGSLNISTLYRLYKEECEKNNKPIAKKCIYRNIFNSEFNISWYTPKKDQCTLCANYANSNEDRKKDLQQEYDDHIRNKEKSRVEKKLDVELAKTDQSIIVSVYDLQAVFPTPCGEVSSFLL
ncbi:hypothetical protein NQ314_009460 [Rhamnusium bicolor]|uniref:Uncharacterized protein n=1 Tax=Rhamnusium bicolor TaxID=1586634 RepID=A0AAV8Y1I3_9CUCU|nr:hypothetical protein NQ314_009460 [Rhamnusium bicolor]